MKKLMFLLILSALFGCSKHPGDACGKKVYTRSFIMKYYEVSEIDISYAHRTWYDGKYTIDLNVIDSDFVTCLDEGEKKDRYDALCVKNNDMTYNREVHLFCGENIVDAIKVGGQYYRYVAHSFAQDIVSMEVVSNAAFDDAHPAGASLNDVFTCKIYTYKRFIDSGYTDYGTEEPTGYPTPVRIIRENLTEVTPDDLVCGWPYLIIFDSLPTLEKTHIFTVTVTLEDGRVLSDTVEITFD